MTSALPDLVRPRPAATLSGSMRLWQNLLIAPWLTRQLGATGDSRLRIAWSIATARYAFSSFTVTRPPSGPSRSWFARRP